MSAPSIPLRGGLGKTEVPPQFIPLRHIVPNICSQFCSWINSKNDRIEESWCFYFGENVNWSIFMWIVLDRAMGEVLPVSDRSSNGDWGRVCKFWSFGVHHKKDHIKINQFIKFEVLSLDCNHVEVFQKSKKIETLYVWIWEGGGGASQN